MLVFEVAAGILIAAGVLFALAGALSASSAGRTHRATDADYRRLVSDYRAGKRNVGPCSYWQHHAAWEEAFPDKAAKRNARPLPLSENYARTLREFYEKYPEEEERDRLEIENWNPNWT